LAKTKEEAEARVNRLGIQGAKIHEQGGKAPPPAMHIPAAVTPEEQSRQRGITAIPETARAIERQIKGAAKAASDFPVPSRRRQSIVLSTHEGFAAKCEPLFKLAGRVIHLAMHPDHHGQMFLAAVIEHEIATEEAPQ
jgi:hypothetical protein